MLEAKDVHKVYFEGRKELNVLKGIDLIVEQGSFIAIVGPSGAGKSTFLHILGGLDRPTYGKVFLAGEDIYALEDARISKLRNEKIGFVFQFYHLLPELNVLENVLLPALIRKEKYSKARQTAMELLIQAGLFDRINHYPFQLSGGERQRVAIVRGLINRPEFLLCDEPTGNLDSENGEAVFSLIKKIHLQNKMTVVLVTHNLELAQQAGKIYRLKDGALN